MKCAHLAWTAPLLVLAPACLPDEAPPPPKVKIESVQPRAEPHARSRVVMVGESPESFAAILAKESAKAKAENLVPYLEFTADWCKPCVAFKKHLHDPRMEAALEGTYIIMVDYDEWSKEAGAMGVTGIPTWLELDANGKPTGRRIDSGVWGEDIPENMAPPLRAFFAKKI